jgi:demethylmenaquinone methyltransferase/2-methoxy-6-polyprenyl-1,4-benzoquinol methylase
MTSISSDPITSVPSPAPSEPGYLESIEVQAMFDRIAGWYDAFNTAMTLGLHHKWRQRAVEIAGVQAGDHVLDVATGTGDLALALARRVGPAGEVRGCDVSDGMLQRAQEKNTMPGWLHLERGDALALPYGSASFDAATVGFGARNFADLDVGLREMVRVVRPGGRVVVLEIAVPTKPPLSWILNVWFDWLMPGLGWLSGHPHPFYLPASVRRFPRPEAIAGKLAEAGLIDVHYMITAGGIIAIHAGTVAA